MIVIGLTGSIGMGKSTVARQFAECGARVSDSDAIVHRLLAPGGRGFRPVAEQFPQVVENGTINRAKLGAIVFDDPQKLRILESILHPLALAAHIALIRQAVRRRYPRVVVLEVPLLFEAHVDALCDRIVTVTAPPFIQRQRVMARPAMTEHKFRRILALQLPDAEKRRRSDYVITTGLGRNHSLRQVRAILSEPVIPSRRIF